MGCGIAKPNTDLGVWGLQTAGTSFKTIQNSKIVSEITPELVLLEILLYMVGKVCSQDYHGNDHEF